MSVLYILIKRNRFWVAAAFLAAFISNLSQMFYMLCVGELVNKIVAGEVIVPGFITVLLVFMISNAVTLFINQYIGRLSAEKMAHTLRMGYADRLIEKTAAGKENIDVASAMSAAQNELAQADAYLGNTFFDISGMLITGLLVLIFLGFQNVVLTMIIFIPTLLILLYVMYSGRKLSKLISAAQDEKNRMNKVAYSAVHAFPVITIFNGAEICKHTLDKRLTIWQKHASKLGRMSAIYNTLSGILSRVPLLFLLLAGAYMVMAGHIMLGTFIVFLNLHKSLTQSVMNLPSWLSGFKIFTANLSRIDMK